jgi:protein phosphatase
MEASIAGTDFLFVGHTHSPFSRQIGAQVVLNPGSVGQPKTGSPNAQFAVWEDGEVFLRSCEYPVAKTTERIRAMPISESSRDFLVRVLETGMVPKSTRERIHVENQRA